METIKFRQVGLNVMITIGTETFSKKMEVKEDRETLKAKVASYEKKPTKKLEQEIRKTMTANTEIKKTEEKIAKKVEKKAVKEVKAVKKEVKKASKEELLEKENKELKAKLAKYETKAEPKAHSGGRREY